MLRKFHRLLQQLECDFSQEKDSKQGYLPLFLSDSWDLLDPVLTFDRLMGGINLNKYLTDILEYTTGRLRYNPDKIFHKL